MRSTLTRRARTVAAVAATAVALVMAGGVVGIRPTTSHLVSTVEIGGPVDRLAQTIRQDQQRLRRVPGDWRTWAALGLAYLEQARVSADPTYYPKADDAVRQSLRVRPRDNPDAIVAQGALANARHDFTTALRLAERAVAADPYDADGYAVLTDAQTQLGNAAAATSAVQHLLDLRPGLSAYARASYDLELHGDTHAAADLMRRALADAVDRADIAFCRAQLGDLAFNAGDLAGAAAQYGAGLAADPHSAALRRGAARTAAATGHLEQALAGYAALTARTPTPGYLLEYAELLRAAGRDADATTQLRLAEAAQRLFVANGGVDGLTGAQLAEAGGDPVTALAQAGSEWRRRRHPDVVDAYAWALHLTGQDRAALAVARQARAGGARSATYAYHLGLIELALGDRDAARTHLREALRINPAFSPLDAPLARRELSTLESYR